MLLRSGIFVLQWKRKTDTFSYSNLCWLISVVTLKSVPVGNNCCHSQTQYGNKMPWWYQLFWRAGKKIQIKDQCLVGKVFTSSQGEKSLGIEDSPKSDKTWTTDGQILIKMWIQWNVHAAVLTKPLGSDLQQSMSISKSEGFFKGLLRQVK